MLGKVINKHVVAEPIEQPPVLGVQQFVAGGANRGEVGEGTGGDLGGLCRRGIVCPKQCAVAVVVIGPGVEQRGVLRADRQGQTLLQRVKVDEVAQDVAADGKQERVATAFKTLEEIRSA